MLDTNLTSAFLVARQVAPAMVRAGRGKILNVCSVQTSLARPGLSAYAASKAGLGMLTRVDVRGVGRVRRPGQRARPRLHQHRADRPAGRRPGVRLLDPGRTPAGRWGRTDDLVGAAVFLTSAASDFVNGQVLTVDGGLTAVV